MNGGGIGNSGRGAPGGATRQASATKRPAPGRGGAQGNVVARTTQGAWANG
jgi:hypothetical protein